jgi:beta-glucosidase
MTQRSFPPDFLWIVAAAHQLGLHEVDRETFERTPKPSAEVYPGIAKAGGTAG